MQKQNIGVLELKNGTIPSVSQHVPELTFKAVFLGIILSVVMGGANLYLGLKVGTTVSACIPAAVISMAVLKFFNQSSILENNIVQTTASAGEVIASAVSVTLPALLMMGYWNHFSPELTGGIAAAGGLLGVCLSIPLRRALILESNLKFPEGVATAEILQSANKKNKEQPEACLHFLLNGGIVAAVLKFFQTGMHLVSENFQYWFLSGPTVMGLSGGFSAAVMGSGYIVGFYSCFSLIIGGIIAWGIGVPFYGFFEGLPKAPSAYETALILWSTKIRLMGVGAMAVGGVWTIGELLSPLKKALSPSLLFSKENQQVVPHTHKDIPLSFILCFLLTLFILIFFIIYAILQPLHPSSTMIFLCFITALMTAVIMALAFLCCAIAGYMCGILGSTHNPLSGVTIVAIFILSGILLFLLDSSIHFFTYREKALQAAGAIVLLGCIVACAAAVSGDNLQDLKSGQLVGATPWKQQTALMIGVIVGAVAIAPLTELLFQAYGIGWIMPREGMDASHALPAPKAALIATLSASIFNGSVDWSMFFSGAGIAIATIAFDSYLKHKKSTWKMPVLGVALGIYMPLEVIVPLFIGGVIHFFSGHKKNPPGSKEEGKRNATLLCAGLIAGESLMGIILAVPFFIYQSTDIFRFLPGFFESFQGILGWISVFFLCRWIYLTASQDH